MASGLQSSGPIKFSEIMTEFLEQAGTGYLNKYGDGESGLTPQTKGSGTQRKFSDYYNREFKVIKTVSNPTTDLVWDNGRRVIADSFQTYEKNARNRKVVILQGFDTIGMTNWSQQTNEGVLNWDLTVFNSAGEIELRNYVNIYAPPGNNNNSKNGGNALKFVTGGTNSYNVTVNNYGRIYGGGGAGGRGGQGGEGQYLVGTTPTLSSRVNGGARATGAGYTGTTEPYYTDARVIPNPGTSGVNNSGDGGASGSGGTWGSPGTNGETGQDGSIEGGGASLSALTFVGKIGVGGIGGVGDTTTFGPSPSVSGGGWPGLQSNVNVTGHTLQLISDGGVGGYRNSTSGGRDGGSQVTGTISGGITVTTIVETYTGDPIGAGQAGGGDTTAVGGSVFALGYAGNGDHNWAKRFGADLLGSEPGNWFGDAFPGVDVTEIIQEVRNIWDTEVTSDSLEAYGIRSGFTANTAFGGAAGRGSDEYLATKHGGNGGSFGQGGGGAGYFGGDGGNGLWGGGGGGGAGDFENGSTSVAILDGTRTHFVTQSGTVNGILYDTATYHVTMTYGWEPGADVPEPGDVFQLQYSLDNGFSWTVIDQFSGLGTDSTRFHKRTVSLPTAVKNSSSVKYRFHNSSSRGIERYVVTDLVLIPRIVQDDGEVAGFKAIDFDNGSTYTATSGVRIVQNIETYPEPDITTLRPKYYGGRGGDGWIAYRFWNSSNQVIGSRLQYFPRPLSGTQASQPYYADGLATSLSVNPPAGTTRMRIYVAGAGGGGGGAGHASNAECGSGGGAGGFCCVEISGAPTNVVNADLTGLAGETGGAAGRAVIWDTKPGTFSFNNLSGGTSAGSYT